MNRPRAAAGFTLVELVFAIAILAILAGLAMPLYRDYLDRARSSAFLVQLDAWREKAAAEAAANGADLCHWDDRRFGAMRSVIFGQASLQDARFGDYEFALAPRDAGTVGSPTGRPFVVDVVATAGDGPSALNVARLLRDEVARVGLRHVSPATDRDLPSMQSFSVVLGRCAGSTASTLPPVVGAIVKPVSQPPQTSGPAVPVPVPASTPGVTLPASAPGGTAPASAPVLTVPASAPGVTVPASAPLVSVPASAPQPASSPSRPPQPAVQASAPALPITTPPRPACSGGRVPSPGGNGCVCAAGHWNPQQQRCVGNSHH